MDIGKKLFELRKAKNLSQEEVAEKLNVTRQTVSKWETNQSTPDFDKIVPLCELFEIGTEELLTGKKAEKTSYQEEQKEKKVLTKEEIRVKSAEVVGGQNQAFPCSKRVFTICCFWRMNSLRSFSR